jgi:hypothetical protein
VAPRRHRFGLYFDLHVRNITGAEVITFLRYLLRHLRGSVVLLWDGGKIHRHRDVQAFLQQYPRVKVHRFPGYAPELNPDEFVWTQAKRDFANTDHDGLVPLTAARRAVASAHRPVASPASLMPHTADLPWL